MQTFENNPMNEQQLDQLLREAFLKQEEEAVQTQTLRNMTSSIVFSNPHFEAEASGRETQFISRLNKSMNRKSWFPGAGLAFVITGLIVLGIYAGFHKRETTALIHTSSTVAATVTDENVTTQNSPIANAVPDPRPSAKETDLVPVPGHTIDSLVSGANLMDTVIQSSVRPSVISGTEEKLRVIPTRIEEDFPVFTPAEIAQNEKRKQRMIKTILKLDMKAWNIVFPGKVTFKGSVYEVSDFFMSSGEVTNMEYKTFLIDLIVQGRKEEYLKSKVDASQWAKIGLPSYAKNYFYNKVYDEHPAVNIPREGAELYCKWLGEEAEKNEAESERKHPGSVRNYLRPALRLPTDIEWAFAAKSKNDSTLYADGLNVIENLRGCELANYKLITGPTRKTVNNKKMAKINLSLSKYIAEDSTKLIPGKNKYCGEVDTMNYYAVPVYSFNPNNYGIYCMAGNAAEMVWAGKNKTAGTMGGSWNSTKTHLLIEGKDEYEGITGPSPFIGFRPVMTFLSAKKK